jgi:hypothetical protein
MYARPTTHSEPGERLLTESMSASGCFQAVFVMLLNGDCQVSTILVADGIACCDSDYACKGDVNGAGG